MYALYVQIYAVEMKAGGGGGRVAPMFSMSLLLDHSPRALERMEKGVGGTGSRGEGMMRGCSLNSAGTLKLRVANSGASDY